MSARDGSALISLAESVADGAAIDWEAAEASASPDDRGVIRQLRVLSDLAGLHRTISSPDAGVPPAVAARQGLPAPAIGRWAHLTLLERLGGGAYGDVYRAWDRNLEREVALKLLRADERVDDPHASRIAREGRLLARVRHPNVITVHGVDVHETRVGLWMELIRGITLEQQLSAAGPLSGREAALIGIDLCRALAAVHGAGLIHRDVKAQNVMREDGGRIVLMDLGTGRETAHNQGRDGGDFAGTPLYLAPEILKGASASERTDLYSLGVLLYHVVTGTFPVPATTVDQLRDGHAAGRRLRLRDARPDLPTAFVSVVERATGTDPGRRYQSAGELEADLVSALAEPVAVVAPPAAPAAAAVEEPAPPASTRFGWLRGGLLPLTIAAALAVVAAVGWPALRRARATPGLPPIRSIAVLPLVNLSGDAQQEYFADGMTDELIGLLGRSGSINVISRTSSTQFKASGKPLPEIAKALHADAVLEGSILVVPAEPQHAQAGRRIRVNARLIYAGTDTQLWDRTFEAVTSDVVSLQEQITRAISDAIHVRLALPQAAAPAQDFEAFDLYLRGRYYWNMRTREGLARSLQYFQAAIDRRPDYALGYAGLADAHNLLGYYGFVRARDAHTRAAAAATKALELDESLPEAHVSLAFLHEDRYEWDAAEARYKRAIALKPGYATAHHWYGYQLAQRGRTDEGIAELRKAVELDPLSVGVNGALGGALVYARQYDAAIEQMERTVQMDPSFARARMELAKAYLLKGDRTRALAESDRAAALRVSDVLVQGDIGYVQAVAGRKSEAQRIARDIAARYRQGEESAAMAAAVVHAGLGDRDDSLMWLERARAASDNELGDIKMDPRFDAIRTDARFAKLLAEVGLSQ
jgi:TolB-like protein/Tfp pilus assembly protein PilF